MLRVLYKKSWAAHYFGFHAPIGWQCPHPQGKSGHWSGCVGDTRESVFHHHRQNTKWWNFSWKNGVASLQQSSRIYAKVHWSCSGSWWPNALLRHFMLVFPLLWWLPVHHTVGSWPGHRINILKKTVGSLPNRSLVELQKHVSRLVGLQYISLVPVIRCPMSCSLTIGHTVSEYEVWYLQAHRQFLPTSHQTAEHLNWTGHLLWFSSP